MGEALPTFLAERLREKGYAVSIASRLDRALASWGMYRSPILILDCSHSPAVSERAVGTICELRHVLKCPVVLAAEDSGKLAREVGRHFAVVQMLQVPCQLDEVLAVIETVERARSKIVGRSNFTLDPTVGSAEEDDAEIAVEVEAETETRVRIDGDSEQEEGYTAAKPNATALVFTPEALSLARSGDLKGDLLLTPRAIGDLQAEGFAPTDPVCLEAGRELLERVGRRGSQQVLRTVTIVGRLMHALNLREELFDVGASAALLYGLGVSAEQGDLLTEPYLSKRATETRHRLSELIKTSAECVSLDVGRDDVAAVLDCYSDIVDRRSTAEHAVETVELATVVFGAELIGRVCFQGGWWNPRDARRILSRLEAGWLEELQAPLAVALVRIVTAAITEQPRGFVVPLKIRHDPALVERARSLRTAKLREYEKAVALVDLVPGMRLARPIETFDGRLLIEGDVTLDHDMIWRLWRLAAIRPVNGPIFIALGGAPKRTSVIRGGGSSVALAEDVPLKARA